MNARTLVCTAIGIAIASLTNAYAEQPPAPCHPNPNAAPTATQSPAAETL